ncbi:hypothetical protein BDV09DRAFT_201225, partial [Aspergillus tetrazonus]
MATDVRWLSKADRDRTRRGTLSSQQSIGARRGGGSQGPPVAKDQASIWHPRTLAAAPVLLQGGLRALGWGGGGWGGGKLVLGQASGAVAKHTNTRKPSRPDAGRVIPMPDHRQQLLDTRDTDIKLNIYVRSRSKLERLVPSVASDARATIFEGSLQDPALIRACLSGATTIIATVGENENIPGVNILRDCARAIIDALSALRASAQDPAGPDPAAEWTPPRLLLPSSATWNARFAAERPALVHWMIRNAFARPYSDLVQGQEMLLGVPELVNVLLVQPNALVMEPATGCVISTGFA